MKKKGLFEEDDPPDAPRPVSVKEAINSYKGATDHPDFDPTLQVPQRGGRSGNPLQPATLDDYMGQEKAKGRIRKYVNASKINGDPFFHTLIIGKAGQGKTTLANIIANELDAVVFEKQAPLYKEELIELCWQMKNGDILLLDEVHLQALARTAAASPEQMYLMMEERKIVANGQGVIEFPKIAVIGCTTDAGLLKPSFRERFPLVVHLEDYTLDELREIAKLNAQQLESKIDRDAAVTFAGACRGIPRELNNMMKQASVLSRALHNPTIDNDLALEVLDDMELEPDGLTKPMMRYLHGLWSRRKWSPQKEECIVKASLQTMCHVIGAQRDEKYVKFEVEPFLIRRGFINIAAGGRELTLKGCRRIGKKWPTNKKETEAD